MKLILTRGPPRSGKSTWAKKQGFPIVNPDSIRLAIHGQPFIAEAEGFVWTTAYTMARALLLAGHETIIIDATNITEKRRKPWVDKFKDCEIEIKEFNASKETCIKRAKATDQDYLIPVIERMADEMFDKKENEITIKYNEDLLDGTN